MNFCHNTQNNSTVERTYRQTDSQRDTQKHKRTRHTYKQRSMWR